MASVPATRVIRRPMRSMRSISIMVMPILRVDCVRAMLERFYCIFSRGRVHITSMPPANRATLVDSPSLSSSVGR